MQKDTPREGVTYEKGRICAVPVTIGVEQGRLVSMYAPADAGERVSFFRRVRADQVIKKRDIVCGDFNCVPDTSRDVKYPPGVRTKYINRGGACLQAIMSGLGLCDTYRLFHGAEARAYSRFGRTVNTRFDRIYAKEYDSPWRWHSFKYDHASFEDVGTDHSAVIAEVATVAKRSATEHEARINPDLLQQEEIRRAVKMLWEDTYERYPPEQYTQAFTWAKAKELCGQYLLQRTSVC